MKECLFKTCVKDKVHINILPQNKNMKGIGNKITNMDMEHLNFHMVINFKGNGSMIKNKEKESLYTLMESHMKVNSKMMQ